MTHRNLWLLSATFFLTACGLQLREEPQPCDAQETKLVTTHARAAGGHIKQADYTSAARSYGLAASIEDSCVPTAGATPCRYHRPAVASAFMVQDREAVAASTRLWIECLDNNPGYVATPEERITLALGAAVAGLESPVSLPPSASRLQAAITKDMPR